MQNVNQFVFSNEPEPHRMRTRQMLKQHPEIKKLIGKNPYSFIAVTFCVFAQIGIAYLLRDQPWWAILLAAFCIGAFISHNLFVFVHESTHNLIFNTKAANHLVAIFANTVQLVPSAISFIRYHIKHHAFQGVHELDADLPNFFEADLFKNRWYGKATWLLTFPIWQIARTFRTKEIKPFDTWMALTGYGCLVSMRR
jgi:sphingolipid delta-4 desaturase